ncbi:MAG: hypothetical protein KJZ74_04960 [Gemmatimonadales bacterium]|nr:hypothetical protein [Gemmatimonadales bacterium]
MRPFALSLVVAGSVMLVPALRAQTPPPTPPDTTPVVPRSMMPPAGKCRIWIAGVPARQQPAPTDCATALRQNPANGTVVYGPPAKEDEDPRFELTTRSRGEPSLSAFRRTSLTERRDSVRDTRRERTDAKTPAAKDAPAPKSEPKSEPAKKPTEPAKKPAEPEKKKPEQP